MSGNVGDEFKVGIGLAKKSLKLYTSFEESDILLCSPIGLKMAMTGTEEDSSLYTDFLASVEILFVDKVFFKIF